MKTCSVVIEWENVLLAEMDRCRRMLRALGGELEALVNSGEAHAEGFEVVVVYPSAEIDPSVIRAVVDEEFLVGSAVAVEVRLASAPEGTHYYEMKNVGFDNCSGGIVAFLDSDVVPEDGWLRNLLSCFEDPAVMVVGGETYIEPTDLVGRSFGLFWFFPLRDPGDTVLREAPQFWANNVAFRREVLEKHRYREIPGTTRGACGRLAQELIESGITIRRQPSSRVSHPAPNGARHFIIRALAEGRDARLTEQSGFAVPRNPVRNLASNVRRSSRSILKNYRRVGLSAVGVPVAAAIATSYYMLMFAGQLATTVSPRLTRGRFQI